MPMFNAKLVLQVAQFFIDIFDDLRTVSLRESNTVKTFIRNNGLQIIPPKFCVSSINTHCNFDTAKISAAQDFRNHNASSIFF